MADRRRCEGERPLGAEGLLALSSASIPESKRPDPNSDRGSCPITPHRSTPFHSSPRLHENRLARDPRCGPHRVAILAQPLLVRAPPKEANSSTGDVGSTGQRLTLREVLGRRCHSEQGCITSSTPRTLAAGRSDRRSCPPRSRRCWGSDRPPKTRYRLPVRAAGTSKWRCRNSG